MKFRFSSTLIQSLAVGFACAAIATADARPPRIPLCSSAQIDRLSSSTSQQVVNTCGIQGRFWVCSEDGKAKCCSANADGSLGHCSSSVSYRVDAMTTPAPGLGGKSPAMHAPVAPVAPIKPGVVPQ